MVYLWDSPTLGKGEEEVKNDGSVRTYAEESARAAKTANRLLLFAIVWGLIVGPTLLIVLYKLGVLVNVVYVICPAFVLVWFAPAVASFVYSVALYFKYND